MLGTQTEIKVTTDPNFLGTGRAVDDIDDAARMSRESLRLHIFKFKIYIVKISRHVYLSKPNQKKQQSIANSYDQRGFSGCVGAIYCCCILRKDCPIEEKEQFHDLKDSKFASTKTEAWCEKELYTWHWIPVQAGTSNEKTMVAFSAFFQNIFSCKYLLKLQTPYKVFPKSPTRTLPFFLRDGIYRWRPIFVLPF